MELVPNTDCLLCKQQTTVLKLDNVKSYLDKLFDTFFDKSNIFKDEFQGMVANTSLCLMCTPKVNICCNLRNDYEDKYNGKCLQKLLSSVGCLLCDGNSTPLTNTQDMPDSLLQQIELFMNSTSFPEVYSKSALCLTCIHSLNIWHEVRSSIMKLRQNDEIDENKAANKVIDYDDTDISTVVVPNKHLDSKKSKTTKNYTTTVESSKEKVNVINLVDSDAEGVKMVDNAGSCGQSRSESPIISNKYSKKFRNHPKTQKLSLTKTVMDKESLISDSSDSEIDGLNKIVDEIVESYEIEEATTQMSSSTSKNKQKITTIDDSSDGENGSKRKTGPKWISKKSKFRIKGSSSDSDNKKAKNFCKLKRRRLSTVQKSPEPKSKQSGHDDEETKDDSSDEENAPKRRANLKLKFRRLSTHPNASPKHKKFDNEDHEKSTIIDDSSDDERAQNSSPEPEILKKKKSYVIEEVTKIADSSSEDERNKRKPKIILKLKYKDQEQITDGEDSSDHSTEKVKHRQEVTNPKLDLTRSDDSSDNEGQKSKIRKSKKTKPVDDSSDAESTSAKRTQKLKSSKTNAMAKNGKSVDDSELETSKSDDSSNESVFETKNRSCRSKPSLQPETSSNKNAGNQITKSDDSSDESVIETKNRSRRSKPSLEPDTSSNKKAGNQITKSDDSSDESVLETNNRSRRSKPSLEPETSSNKKAGNQITKSDDSSDESVIETKNRSRRSKPSLEPETSSNKKARNQITKSNDSSDESVIETKNRSRRSKLSLEPETSSHKKAGNQITKSDDSSDESVIETKNRSRRSKPSLQPETSSNKNAGNQITKSDDSSDESVLETKNRSRHSKLSLEPETLSHKKAGNQITKSDDSSDESVLETKNRSRRSKLSLEPETSSHKKAGNQITKSDDSSDESVFETKNRSRRSKPSLKPETSSHKKAGNLITKINDSSDSESEASNLQNKRQSRRLQTSEKKKAGINQATSSKLCDASEERVTKRPLRSSQSTRQQIIVSDSSDQENMATTSSQSQKTMINNAVNIKERDKLLLYLKLQSVKKLHKKENIHLPSSGLDDKLYKQVPYVLLKKNELQSIETVTKKFPKINLKSRKRKPTKQEDGQRVSRRINKSPITISLSDDTDDEHHDISNSSFVDIETLSCHICDKTHKKLWESKAHDLFHIKPEVVVINVARENLKKLQEKYNRQATQNINLILSKYLGISENSVSDLQETLSNGHSSAPSVEDEDPQLQLKADSTSTKAPFAVPKDKSSSASEDNSDCENIPNVVNEKKRKLSILLNNSRDKSESSSPNPKRVRFALDHKTSIIPNLQPTEDLSKPKSKSSKDVHNLIL